MNEHNPLTSQENSHANGQDSSSIWLRLFFMLVVTFLYSVSRVVVGAVVVIQFFWVLLKNEKNQHLIQLGHSLAIYSYQITYYLTFNTEERPYPFDLEWPKSS